MKRPFVDWVLIVGICAGGVVSLFAAIVVVVMSK